MNLQKKSMRRAALVVLPLALLLGKPVLRWLDFTFFHERIRDGIGQLISNEDWSTAVPLPTGLDKRWLEAGRRDGLDYIAHALGGAGGPTSNTLAAFLEAKRRGYRLFEVDLWLDESGRLRCHHGPEAVPPYDPASSCTLERLLPLVDQANGWLILDIKTDFYQTAEKILKTGRALGLSHRMVFQLYRPEELRWFGDAEKTTPLPLPIVTVYNARRSANHIASHAAALNIQVLTVPTDKINTLAVANRHFALMTHPVDNCVEWNKIRRDLKVDGIYAIQATDISQCRAN